VNGIIVAPSGSGSAKAVFDRVRVENGLGHGFSFSGSGTTGSVTATVSDSVAAGNGNTGIFANVGAGTTTVMIDRSASVNNATGIRVRTSIQFPAGAATARIGDSTVSGNTTGLDPELGGSILSYGTNKVNDNGTDGAPTSTISMK
jgi:hypothetical protein